MGKLIALVALFAIAGCCQKTVIEIPGSDNSVAVTITTREDKDIAIAPATSVSQGTATASGSSAVRGEK